MQKVSVVTVTKNNVYGLSKTLESLCSLEFKPYEVIIMDGNSNDETRILAQSFCGQLPIRFFSESDSGIYDAMNKGRFLARGRWIHYLNAGDYVFGEPYKAIGPLLPVYGVRSGIITKKGFYHRRRSYCHQGIFFSVTHPEYNLEYEICADFDLMLKCFANGFNKSMIAQHYAGVVFDLGGISSKRFIKRDIEIIKILYSHRMCVDLFLFSFKMLIKAPINYILRSHL